MADGKCFVKNTSYISEERKAEISSLIANNEPKNEEDLIVLVAHAVVLRNGFKIVCVGRYEDDHRDPPENQGDSLPRGWNKRDDPECYELSYIKTEKKTIYYLKCLVIEEKLCFTLLERGQSYARASQVQVAVNDHVIRKGKPATYEWLHDAGFLWKLIEKGLFGMHEDLFEKRDEEVCAKLMELERPRLEMERPPNLLLQDNVPVQHPDILRETSRFERPSPFAYGDADRLPGHPGIGGMMMDPLRSGGMGLRPPSYPGIPRGSVPPGARFDPFGPLTEFDYRSGGQRPPRSFDPNPDHLRRPGFNEDMFM